MEHEIFLQVANQPDIVADIHHGYIAQLSGDHDGGTQLRLATTSRLGLHDDATLRQMLRDTKKDLQAARQAYEDALRHLRKAGANI
ncbi:hypothetical protein [Nonomuraea diastatica]|uniref:Uncharacterized protein n=1 Tax=Nonomuraea diastatica TaxID=1848329 RepID=A0A4R4VE79_9ACTN|nr:hypothetical protein [Nonomuraea diastatica]TDD03848.1 hypothetical protein E1294_50500 [Nonomuraea diastatica]